MLTPVSRIVCKIEGCAASVEGWPCMLIVLLGTAVCAAAFRMHIYSPGVCANKKPTLEGRGGESVDLFKHCLNMHNFALRVFSYDGVASS